MVVVPACDVRSIGIIEIVVAYVHVADNQANVMRLASSDVRLDEGNIGLRHSVSSFDLVTNDVAIGGLVLLEVVKRSRRLRGNVSKGLLI